MAFAACTVYHVFSVSDLYRRPAYIYGGTCGLLTLAQAAADVNLGIDELLYRYPSGGRYAGRMSVVTALCFVLMGLCLLGLRRPAVGPAAGLLMALLACAIVALALAVVAASLLGLSVPRDICIAGFDDIPTLRDHTPSLSTVALPLEEIGARAVELALRSDPEADDLRERIPGLVVLRDSTRL